jgi:hypothetical protein
MPAPDVRLALASSSGYVCAPPSQSNTYRVNRMAATINRPKKMAANHDPSLF